MNILQMYFKKIINDRKRLILTGLLYGFAFFIGFFFVTICVNIWDEVSNIQKNDVRMRTVYVFSTNLTQEKKPETFGVKCDQSILACESFFISCMNDIDVNVPVYSANVTENFVVPGKGILAGRLNLYKNEMIIGMSVLDENNLDPKSVIGNKVIVNNGAEYTVSGVYDDSDIVVLKSILNNIGSNDECLWMFKCADIKDVEDISAGNEALGFEVDSYYKDIKMFLTVSKIGCCVCAIICILVVMFISYVVYGGQMNILRDMFTFIAMLKAVGYKKKSYAQLVFILSTVTMIVSCIVVGVVYPLSMFVFRFVLMHFGVNEIYGVDVGCILMSRIECVLCFLGLYLIGIVFVNLFCLNNIEKTDICKILYEVTV